MTTSIGQSIDALCKEHGIDRDLVIEAMKDAVKAAARKQFRAQDKTGDHIEVEWNNDEGMIEISLQKVVVAEVEDENAELSLVDAQELAGDEIEIGDMLQIPLPQEEMGRIAAQTAKQILVQKVREALREKVYEEYIDKKGTMQQGTIKRFERGDLIIEFQNGQEAVLPRKQQSRGEMWNQGERIRAVIMDVSKEQKGQQIILSRASEELVKQLFELEVPEIYDGTVVIKSCVREPGDRAKIAVTSNEKDVDPVGACVGMKGSRVQSIIKELRGEKIDIIQWSDEPSVFAANALSPAKVSQVRITDIENRRMDVIVGEDQLSLAIGKRGQNVRLATRLVGWDINIVSEEVLKKEIAKQMGQMMASGAAVPIAALEGVSANHAELLEEKGIKDVEALASTSVDDIVDILDVSLDEAERIVNSAAAIVEARNAQIAPEEIEGGSDDGVPEESGSAGEASVASDVEAAESSEEEVDEEATLEGDESAEIATAETMEKSDVTSEEEATEEEATEEAISEDVTSEEATPQDPNSEEAAEPEAETTEETDEGNTSDEDTKQ